MIISGDIVIVDGWQFGIDRTVPKITSSLGKGEKQENIQINIASTVSSDYVKADIVIEISYEKEIEKLIINGEEISPIPEPVKQEGKNIYRIEKEETNNKTYTVIAKDIEGKYNIGTGKITDITEDIEIWNKADMEKFRDKVNSGRTFETKTARVMADIDLEGTEESQWLPIGINNAKFNGIFEGNYHKIKNLYIDSDEYINLGLFTEIRENGIIQNTILENVYINNAYSVWNEGSYTGGISGSCSGKITNCGVNSGTINAHRSANFGNQGGSWKAAVVGGISGSSGEKEILNCYNKADIYGESLLTGNNSVYVGGITGASNKIYNCYNKGNVNGVGRIAIVGGIVGEKYRGELANTYNIGNVGGRATYESYFAGISGRLMGSNLSDITNSYCKKDITYSVWRPMSTNGVIEEENIKSMSSTLGEAYTDDVNNINEGYPILKWQLNLDKDN